MVEDSFKHEPLPDSHTQFRLLEFLPTHGVTDVYCALTTHHVTSSSPPTYVGVSYEWGTGEPSHRISLDGQAFYIRGNLWRCMLQLRRHNLARYYWIDAICIDQNNVVERNAQVQCMGKIFAGACCTASWIGDGDERSRSAMEFLDRGERGIERLLDSDKEEARRICEVVTEELLYRPYWRRLWIVQEVLIAKHVNVLCAEAMISFQNMLLFFTLCRRRLRDANNAFEQAVGFDAEEYDALEFKTLYGRVVNSDAALTMKVGSRFHPYKSENSMGILDLLAMFCRRTICKDIRDKVFGLLGLDEAMGRFTVDYSKPAWLIYLDMLLHLYGCEKTSFRAMKASTILQRALMIQSNTHVIAKYISGWEQEVGNSDKRFHDFGWHIATVIRAADKPKYISKSLGVQDLNDIVKSLKIIWLDNRVSVSGKGFTRSQKTLLNRLVEETWDREDPFQALKNEHYAFAWSTDIPETDVQDTIEQYKIHETTSEQLHARFFLTTTRQVGCGFGPVEAGDILLSSFGKPPMTLVIRRISSDRDVFRVIGRASMRTVISRVEEAAMKDKYGIDINNDEACRNWSGPDNYWAPQTSNLAEYKRVPAQREQDSGKIYELAFDLRSLAALTELSYPEIEKSNDIWLKELHGMDGARNAPLPRNDAFPSDFSSANVHLDPYGTVVTYSQNVGSPKAYIAI